MERIKSPADLAGIRERAKQQIELREKSLHSDEPETCGLKTGTAKM